MKAGIVDFTTYLYIKWARVFWAPALVIFGISIIILRSNYPIGIAATFFGVLAWTSRYGIWIDTVNKKWLDYFSILGIKNGQSKPYATIEYIFIKSSNQRQTLSSQVATNSVKPVMFDAYLKFDQDEKVYLLTKSKKIAVLAFAERLAKALNVPVVDHTVAAVE